MQLRFRDKETIRALLARAINNNQLLILLNVDGISTITALLRSISRNHHVPLSTLKLNAKILKELGLLAWTNKAELTGVGSFVVEVMGREPTTTEGDNQFRSRAI